MRTKKRENQETEEEAESALIEDLVSSCIMPHVIQFLVRDDFRELQVFLRLPRCCPPLLITQIMLARVMVDQGAFPFVVKILDSLINNTRKEDVQALNDIPGDSLECRDMVLSLGAFPHLLALLTEDVEPSMQRKATQALANFYMGKPQANNHPKNKFVDLLSGWTTSFAVIGFGFCEFDNDYKVIRVVYFSDDRQNFMGKVKHEVEVYNLKRGSWRKVEDHIVPARHITDL
ncbi:hypothetical protein Vadar_024063 [Vaccinium darrowii]|uniref:Uncharacterized protein n=1 Tax=Vaccinium darrowii TaxID=229202 RepID=A0ACB7XUC9_9ERIC|nr:hypothetical protein Vadar_024063 [Vaccinium darrowii]